MDCLGKFVLRSRAAEDRRLRGRRDAIEFIPWRYAYVQSSKLTIDALIACTLSLMASNMVLE